MHLQNKNLRCSTPTLKCVLEIKEVIDESSFRLLSELFMAFICFTLLIIKTVHMGETSRKVKKYLYEE